MTISARTPTVEQILDIADSFGLHLTVDDAKSFRGIMAGTMASYARVDEHRHPVAELRRVFEVARHQLLPFVDGMPSRKNPLGDLPESVAKTLLEPPPFRPGGGGSAP